MNRLLTTSGIFRSLNEAISADVQHYSIQMQNLIKGKKNQGQGEEVNVYFHP